jgi:predicted dehydrogenase
MSEKACIAVIGTGWWSTMTHIPTLAPHERVDPLILVDRNPEAGRAAADKYGVPHEQVYTSLAEAKQAHPEMSGAIVAVPHHAHVPVAKEALDLGLHLLVEKPMTLYATDARELAEIADAKGLEILMGYTFPYLDPVVAAKRRIDDGLLGDIEYVHCNMTSMTIEFYRGNPGAYNEVFNYPVGGPGENTYSDPAVSGGGQAHLQITHLAAMMLHLAPGLRGDVVTAFMNSLDTKVDVVDAIALRLSNGGVATLGSSGNIAPGDPGSVEVHLHGSKGRLRVDAISGEMYMRLHNGRTDHIAASFPGYPGSEPSKRFVEMLLDGAAPLFPGRSNGLYTVEILDAAYRSAEAEGRPVRVADLYR